MSIIEETKLITCGDSDMATVPAMHAAAARVGSRSVRSARKSCHVSRGVAPRAVVDEEVMHLADARLTIPGGLRSTIDGARVLASLALIALILLQGPKGEGIASALSESQLGEKEIGNAEFALFETQRH